MGDPAGTALRVGATMVQAVTGLRHPRRLARMDQNLRIAASCRRRGGNADTGWPKNGDDSSPT